ncbi:MAG TPA: CotH kinase family protein [Bacteroidia bacterium]|nr:CotH kinase family protein [Bacteroidia bacterium]
MKRTIRCTPIFILFFSLSLSSLKAQVVINEFSCSNLSQYIDNHSDYNDWIELYNAGTSSVSLTGYYLSDDSLDNLKWQIPAGITIASHGFLRFWASGRDEVSGSSYHTNFTLKQTKNNNEWVVLSNTAGVFVDSKEISQKTQLGHSYGRYPDSNNSWAIFTTPSPNSSNNSAFPYIDYADKPDFNVPAGFYASAQTVSITTTEPSSQIRYTTDGTLPTATSTVYTGPVSITTTKVLKAITFSSNLYILPSFIEFNTYFINSLHTVPVVSIAGDQLTTLANGNGNLEPKGTFEYFNTSQVRTANTYGEFNEHGQDSWALSQRSLDFVSRDEMGYNHSIEEQLFTTTPLDNFQRVILRAAGDDNYPADHHTANLGSAHLRDAFVHSISVGLNLEVRRASKCVVYLNGVYWGVYDLRDNPDNHDNTEYYYGQDKYHLYMLKRWGNSWAEYGGTAAFTEWDNLYNYIYANNMSVPANYQYVTDRFDVTSLVDYVLVNMFTVCSDWLNWNTCWWRGLDSTGTHLKWGYQLWDNDATFGHYINYTGIPNTTPTAEPCDPEGLNGSSDPDDHIGVLLRLRQNPDFNQYYITRQFDLWNTVFSCDNMLPYLDSMVAVIDPEMTAHSNRWFGTYTEWQTNVQILRDFITQRCTSLTAGWISCYSVNGPYDITLNADPAGAGSIKMNSLTHTQLPWIGTYFGGIDSKFNALANSNYQFVSWTSNSQVFNPNSNAVNVTVDLTSNDSIVAHFLTTSIPELLPINEPIVSAYPTVTNGSVIIQYSLPEAASVSLKLFSLTGDEITEIKNPAGKELPGNHQAEINLTGSGLAAGVYMLQFNTADYKKSIKLLYAPQ